MASGVEGASRSRAHSTRFASVGLIVSLAALAEFGCSSGTADDPSELTPSAVTNGGGLGGQSGSGGTGPVGGSGGPGGSGGDAGGSGGSSGSGGSGGLGGSGGSGGGAQPDDVLVIAGDQVQFDETVWPTTVMSVTSPFGPRLQASRNFAYDFHRGIDIGGPLGARINAIADGVVYDVIAQGEPGSAYPSGGNVVVLKHEADVPIPFHGDEYTTYYSVYMHLRSMTVSKGNSVAAGQRVGTMGESGATEFVHLHLETRIGTTCSLGYQLANPETNCGPSGFDPHVNPFLFVSYPNTDNLEASVLFEPSAMTISVISRLEELDVNSVRINGVGVDFNSRDGIDAADMDNPSHGGVNIAPEEFITTSTEYGLSVRIEGGASLISPDPDWTTIVEVYDVWGGGRKFRFGTTR